MLKTCLLKCAEAKLRKSSIESIATRLCDEALLSMSDERKVLQDVPSPARVSFDVLIVNGCPFFLENLDKLGGFKDGRGKVRKKEESWANSHGVCFIGKNCPFPAVINAIILRPLEGITVSSPCLCKEVPFLSCI